MGKHHDWNVDSSSLEVILEGGGEFKIKDANGTMVARAYHPDAAYAVVVGFAADRENWQMSWAHIHREIRSMRQGMWRSFS